MTRSMSGKRRFPRWMASLVVTGASLASASASAAPITFHNLAEDPSANITYRRARSTIDSIFDAIKLRPFMAAPELAASPLKSRGAPGVALIDYDGDGDLDIYVTNGPGRPNSLYQNQLAQTGNLAFVDVGVAAGVGAAAQDSTGVCFGDIDNDGDPDLLVLGRMEANRLFRNEGNGTFTDITASSNVGGGVKAHTSCAMGDLNGDGLLDIFVGNTFDWSRQDAIHVNRFSFNHANQLYFNRGGNVFEDVSESAGILTLENVPPGDATITWGVALVDYDQDGDLDILHADDQAALTTSGFAGIDRGVIQVFNNDGTGKFTNVTRAAGLAVEATSWMGLSFGDLNHDGHLDFFATSVGDYLARQQGAPLPQGQDSSSWFLGGPGGTFVRPGVGDLVVTPFGWGTELADYDNDGDTDIIFYGGMDVAPYVQADNPGIILRNDGNANFTWDRAATASSAEFVLRQEVQGMAVGDLNGDGFVDIVHVSSAFSPSTLPLVPANQKWGSPFDDTAFIVPTFTPIGPGEWEWSGVPLEDGFLGIQVNSASNGNGWVKVDVRGTKGLTTNGRVNRDGIGAIVKFTPKKGKQVMSPVLGGSSYASQHALTQYFGMGDKKEGMIEVLWPGGVRNRLYKVKPGEHVTLPEIPCDAGGQWAKKKDYEACVDGALSELGLDAKFQKRLRDSAMTAYKDLR